MFHTVHSCSWRMERMPYSSSYAQFWDWVSFQGSDNTRLQMQHCQLTYTELQLIFENGQVNIHNIYMDTSFCTLSISLSCKQISFANFNNTNVSDCVYENLWKCFKKCISDEWKGLAHRPALIHLNCVLLGWSSSSTSSPLIHAFKALMHKVTVMLEEEGVIPKLFPQSWKTSGNSEALRVLFTRNDGSSPNPEQHHAILPTPPNFTLDTSCSQTSVVLLANQTSPLDCQKEEHSEWFVLTIVAIVPCYTPISWLWNIWEGWNFRTGLITYVVLSWYRISWWWNSLSYFEQPILSWMFREAVCILDSTRDGMAALLFIRPWNLFNVSDAFITKWSETVVIPLTFEHNSFTSDKRWRYYRET